MKGELQLRKLESVIVQLLATNICLARINLNSPVACFDGLSTILLTNDEIMVC